MRRPCSPEAARIERRVGAVVGFANLDGAVFTFLYLAYVAPADVGGDVESDLLGFLTFVAVVFPLFALWTATTLRRAVEWYGLRTPTDVERERVLRLPMRLAAQCFAGWLFAAIAFPVLDLATGESIRQGVRLAVTIFDGGLVTSAVSFFLVERLVRPVATEALADEPPRRLVTMGVRPRLVLAWVLGSAVPLAGLLWLPIGARWATERTNIGGAVVALASTGLLVGMFVTVAAARSVAGRIERLREALDRVRDGHLDVQVPVDDGGEIGILQSGLNEMVAGLRERQRLSDLFGRQVGADVARLALEQGTGLESEQREASVLFVDLVGSTAMAEVLAPEDVVATLNALFAAVVRCVGAEGGWVNKFEGDGALCVFGAPAVQPDHAARALRAARGLRAELDALSHDHPGLDAAIGVSSGVLVAGNVGTEQRYEYTVIGRPVNEAARLTDLAKGRGGRVVAGAGAVERSGDEAARWSSLGTVALRGQSTPTAIFEPVPVREAQPA